MPSENASLVPGRHQYTCYPGNLGDGPWEPRCRSMEKACVLKAIKSLHMQLKSALTLQKPMPLFPLCFTVQWRWNTGPQKAIRYLIEQSYYISFPSDCDFHRFRATVGSRCKWLCYSRCEYIVNKSNFVRAREGMCVSICVHSHHLPSPELPQMSNIVIGLWDERDERTQP